MAPVVRDPVPAALKYSIGRAKLRGQDEVLADDLLMGCLQVVSRFGVVELGDWVIDLEELGVEWRVPLPKTDARLAYSDRVVEILDRAAVLSKFEGSARIGVEHVLVCFASETSGIMGMLRERYGIEPVRWRAAVARLGGAAGPEAAGGAQEPEYLSPEEAAEVLGVHVQTLRGYIRSGKLPALRVAGERVIRIRRSSLDTLLEPLAPEPTI